MFFGQITGDQLEESVITYEIEKQFTWSNINTSCQGFGQSRNTVTNQEAEISRYFPFKN